MRKMWKKVVAHRIAEPHAGQRRSRMPGALRAAALAVALLFLIGCTGCQRTTDLFNETWEEFFALLARPEPTAAAATLPPETPAPAPDLSAVHPGIPFSQMAYERPDTEALADLLSDLLFDMERGADEEALLDRYDEALSLYNAADCQLSLCYVLYAKDVTNTYYRDEYASLYTALTELDLTMTEVSVALLDSGSGAREHWGDSYAEAVIAGADLNSPEIQPLLEREQTLTMAYDELLSSFCLQDGGRTYTIEEIGALAPEDYEEYVRLYDAYAAALNREAGAIFLDLLAIRHDIAAKLGYGSYAAYMYDCYGRDYSVTDAKALQDAVKRCLVPVYEDAVMRQYMGGSALMNKTYTQPVFLKALRAAAADFSPQLLEALDYMLQYGLYDFSPDPNKMETSFTTYFSSYDAPFMFTAWTNSFTDTGTVIHELGHYTNYYHNAAVGWSVADPLDLAEVDSQGLELLMIPYYPSFYGKDAASAELYRMADAMYAVLTGCMEDEFQQLVYADPGMTLEEMNALYLRLAEEYGFAELYGFTGTEWTMIPHTFQSPMYYISYAVSMIPALELWERSATDAAAAREAYFEILNRAPYAQFRRTVQSAGLSDPLQPETIERIAEVLHRAYGF